MSASSAREWGFWTEQKLEILADYLNQFLFASTRAPTRIYIDAFSGDGAGVSKHNPDRSILGSARVALNAGSGAKFTTLRFFDINAKLVQGLASEIDSRFPGRDAMAIEGDCNLVLPETLEELKRRKLHYSPTFAFLDPDGLELHWSTVKSVSDFKRELVEDPSVKIRSKAEMFILLNTNGFIREVSRDMNDAAPRLNSLVGSDEWVPIAERMVSKLSDGRDACAEFTNLIRWRLENELGYRQTIDLPFFNTKNSELYRMVFATDHNVGGKIMAPLFRRAAFFGDELRSRAVDESKRQMSFDISPEVGPPPNNLRFDPPIDPASYWS